MKSNCEATYQEYSDKGFYDMEAVWNAAWNAAAHDVLSDDGKKTAEFNRQYINLKYLGEKEIWNAAWNSAKKYFSNIEFIHIDWESRPWAAEVRVGYCAKHVPPNQIGDRIATFARPSSTWEPKNGQTVLFNLNETVSIGVWNEGKILVAAVSYDNKEVSPFNPETDFKKIGSSWSSLHD